MTQVFPSLSVNNYILGDGVNLRSPVRLATTGPGTLSSDFENSDIVDGIALTTGDRILIKNQALDSENGVYIVQASGTPVRDRDSRSGVSANGLTYWVQEGNTNDQTGWVGRNVVGTNATYFRYDAVGTLDVDRGGTGASNLDGIVIGNGTSALTAVKSEFNQTTPPTVNDDADDDYAVGSRWVDTTGGAEYICVDASVGAAVWINTTITNDYTPSTPGDWDVAPSNISTALDDIAALVPFSAPVNSVIFATATNDLGTDTDFLFYPGQGGSLQTGTGNTLSGDGGLVIGDNNTVSADYAFAGGQSSVANKNHAFAFGDGVSATGPGSVALTQNSTASGDYSMAVGRDAAATIFDSVAIGRDARAGATSSIAIGRDARVNDGRESIAIGKINANSDEAQTCIAAVATNQSRSNIDNGAESLTLLARHGDVADDAIILSARDAANLQSCSVKDHNGTLTWSYSPTTPADWSTAPADIGTALDDIGSKLFTSISEDEVPYGNSSGKLVSTNEFKYFEGRGGSLKCGSTNAISGDSSFITGIGNDCPADGAIVCGSSNTLNGTAGHSLVGGENNFVKRLDSLCSGANHDQKGFRSCCIGADHIIGDGGTLGVCIGEGNEIEDENNSIIIGKNSRNDCQEGIILGHAFTDIHDSLIAISAVHSSNSRPYVNDGPERIVLIARRNGGYDSAVKIEAGESPTKVMRTKEHNSEICWSYTPDDNSNWTSVPDNVGTALDELAANTGASSSTTVFYYTADDTLVVPSGTTKISIEIQGGGGGGGGGERGSTAGLDGTGGDGGNGGGSGFYKKSIATVVPSETLTITVGDGGTGGTGETDVVSQTDGGTGGTSSISGSSSGSIIDAIGGSGGGKGPNGTGGDGWFGGGEELNSGSPGNGTAIYNGTGGGTSNSPASGAGGPDYPSLGLVGGPGGDIFIIPDSDAGGTGGGGGASAPLPYEGSPGNGGDGADEETNAVSPADAVQLGSGGGGGGGGGGSTSSSNLGNGADGGAGGGGYVTIILLN